MLAIIVFAVLCFIVPSFIWALFLLINRLRSKEAIGTVIGQDAASFEGSELYAPIVEFQLPDGRKITFTEKMHSNENILDSLFNLFSKFVLKRDLDKVKVLYDPNNPQKARVNTFGNLYFMPAIIFAIGIFLILYAIPMFRDILDSIFSFIERLTKNL
jgi:hypothetical protein